MLYDIGFAIFSLFYLPALIFKGKLHADFAERFGNFSPDKRKALEDAQGAIWIQAVSVGEVSLCRSLIPELKIVFPGKQIVLSTITKTGNNLAKKLFSSDALVIYFPLDFSFIARKAVALIKPAVYIMIETEIWPNFLKETARNNIPAILLNGRISDRSFGKYMFAAPFIKNTLTRVDRFCMQSDQDGKRIISIGAPKEKVSVTGNMKFDIEINTDAKSMDMFRETLSLKADEELFVAGSTHRGEEELILSAYRELLKDFPKLRLLIAPRHIERAQEVRTMVNNADSIYILDKIGYLTAAYSFASIVFIGGSLVKHGGQNPIEPAVLGKPVLFGPNMFNFKDITKLLLDNDAAIQVSNKEDIIEKAKLLLSDKPRRDELGRNARTAVAAGRGATSRNVEAVKKFV